MLQLLCKRCYSNCYVRVSPCLCSHRHAQRSALLASDMDGNGVVQVCKCVFVYVLARTSVRAWQFTEIFEISCLCVCLCVCMRTCVCSNASRRSERRAGRAAKKKVEEEDKKSDSSAEPKKVLSFDGSAAAKPKPKPSDEDEIQSGDPYVCVCVYLCVCVSVC